MKTTRSFLTEEQKKVLKLRDEGYTQREIAQMLGTSRANISIIEKRARLNLEKAKATIKEYSILLAPVRVKIKKGMDVINVPKLIFKHADKRGIKVRLNSLDLIARINAEKKDKIENRIILEDFEVYIAKNGDVIFA
ncbi:MAG: Tfx family DNA-binding protein [Methanocellales archaeon]